MLVYLDQLGEWLGQRRAELDRLDRALAQRPSAGAQTGDLMVALSVWQAVQRRYQDLLRGWDSGRVGAVQLSQLSQLIWSRLDDAQPQPVSAQGPAAGLSVNLPEACRLSDALTAQLTAQLSLTALDGQASLRLSGLRAQVERLRQQVELEPADDRTDWRRQVDQMAESIDQLAAMAGRGGDIGGRLGPIEIQAAQLERDLIVGNARRRRLAQLTAQAQALRERLGQRETELAALVERVRGRVQPAPKYALPRLAALGQPPADEAELNLYRTRLETVAQALDLVERANRAAWDDWTAAGAELTRLRDQERGARRPDAATAGLADQAEELLSRRPTPMAVLRPILDAYAAALDLDPAAERTAAQSDGSGGDPTDPTPPLPTTDRRSDP
jgi:hypothetical protein